MLVLFYPENFQENEKLKKCQIFCQEFCQIHHFSVNHIKVHLKRNFQCWCFFIFLLFHMLFVDMFSGKIDTVNNEFQNHATVCYNIFRRRTP